MKKERGIELVSVHLPKTAGTAFLDILFQVYGKDNIFLDYNDKIGDPLSQFNTDYPNWLKNRDNFIKSINPDALVIHGHFSAVKYDGYFADAKRIVWLREPISRLISHYFYWVGIPPSQNSLHKVLLEKNLSLLEFAELPTMQNRMSRIFFRDVDINHFYFIGIQEFFEDDLAKLAVLMDWPRVTMPIVNRTNTLGYSSFDTDKSLMEKLAFLNKEDIGLYQTALKLREGRIKQAIK